VTVSIIDDIDDATATLSCISDALVEAGYSNAAVHVGNAMVELSEALAAIEEADGVD
jgi:hypothetical protein